MSPSPFLHHQQKNFSCQSIAWKEMCLHPSQSDLRSSQFHHIYLPSLRNNFTIDQLPPWELIDPLSLNTQQKPLRLYFVGMKSRMDNSFVFVRNETRRRVENWGINLTNNHWIEPGDFVEMSAMSYTKNYGGLTADLFTMTHETLLSTSWGTNAFASLTSPNTQVYHFPNQPLYFIHMRLAQQAQFAMVLQLFNI